MRLFLLRTFAKAKCRLSPGDLRRVEEFIGKLQGNPENPGTHLEPLKGCLDPGFWSARVSEGIRVILHRSPGTMLLAYVGQHEDAYRWAAKRRLGRNRQTGVFQIEVVPDIEVVVPSTDIVEVEESVADVQRTDDNDVRPEDFSRFSTKYLLELGVPASLVDRVHDVQSQESLLELIEVVPEDAMERLLALAEGQEVRPPRPLDPDKPVEASPENTRVLHVIEDDQEAR